MNPLHPAPVPVAAPSGNTFASAYAIFSVVFLITMIATTAITYILPESYASTARLKVELPTTADGFSALRTEVEIIQSQVVLEKVMRALNLNVLWGKKYFNGENLKTGESLTILKSRLIVSPVANTPLLAISAYSDERREAAQVANAVAQAYQTYALERQAKTQMETTNASVLLTAPVLIVDQAEPALRPCKPNKPLNLALGAGVGLVLGGLAAAFVGFLKPHFSR